MLKITGFVCACIAAALVALSGSPALSDSFALDHGNVAASGQQITITRLPIVLSNGKILYRDVTIKFGLDAKRRLTVVKGFPKTKNSPAITSAKLVAGRYLLNNTSSIFDLLGPGVGPDGREAWSLVGVNNSGEVNFVSGPVNGHPLQERLNDAGITSSPYTFGVSSNGQALGPLFGGACLAAAHILSGRLKLDSHTTNNCTKDTANPATTLTLRRCTKPDCT